MGHSGTIISFPQPPNQKDEKAFKKHKKFKNKNFVFRWSNL